MIQEAYVSFETARLLKEKGFDEECNKVIHQDTKNEYYFGNYSDEMKGRLLLVPTQQMAMSWLRENHNIHIVIEPTTAWFGTAMGGEYRMVFELRIEEWNFNPPRGHGFPDKRFCSYEEACEAAIKHCLEHLIG